MISKLVNILMFSIGENMAQIIKIRNTKTVNWDQMGNLYYQISINLK
jgi:hypothetical protein